MGVADDDHDLVSSAQLDSLLHLRERDVLFFRLVRHERIGCRGTVVNASSGGYSPCGIRGPGAVLALAAGAFETVAVADRAADGVVPEM